MKPDWLEAGENMIGDWKVFLGDPTPNSPKIAGTLYVTDKSVIFAAELALDENAAAKIGGLRHYGIRRQSRGPAPFAEMNQQFTIPLGDIQQAEMVKKKLVLKSLLVTMKSGDQYDFNFGMASPAKAVEAIRLHI